MANHDDIALNVGIHADISFEYADAATRLAAPGPKPDPLFSSDPGNIPAVPTARNWEAKDVRRKAIDLDTGRIFRLVSISPEVWEQCDLASGATAGQVPVSDGNGNWPAQTLNLVDSINDCSDVNTAGAVDGDILTLVGGIWVPQTPVIPDASVIAANPFSTIAATNVQEQLEEIFAEAGGAPPASGNDYTDNVLNSIVHSHHWEMDDASGGVEDVQGSLNATEMGTVLYGQTGLASANNNGGTSVKLSGAEAVVVAHDAALDLGNGGAIGIAFWFAGENPGGTAPLLFSKKVSGGVGYSAFLTGSGLMTVRVDDGTNNEQVINGLTGDLRDDSLIHHCAINIDLGANLIECTIDGDTASKKVTAAISPPQTNVDNAVDLKFGNDEGELAHKWNGRLGHFVVKIGGTFSDPDIAALFDGGPLP